MDYPELNERRSMLETLHQRYEEHVREVEETGGWDYRLRLDFTQIGPLGQQAGLDSKIKSIALFKQLIDDGFVRAQIQANVMGMAYEAALFEGLTIKGKQEIGKLPGEQERFIAAIEEVLRRVEENPDVPEVEKARLRKMAEAAITFARDTGRMGLMQFVLGQMGL